MTDKKIIEAFETFKETHPKDSNKLNMARAIIKTSTLSLAEALQKAQELV